MIFLKLSNFYDLALLSRTPSPKTYPPPIENKNSDSPKEHFLGNLFSPSKKGTCGGHYENTFTIF